MDRKLVLSHRAHPGPGHWEYLCILCGHFVDDHGTWLMRRAWRKQQRRRQRAAWRQCCKGTGGCPSGGCPAQNVSDAPSS